MTTTTTAVSVSQDPPPSVAPEPTGVRGLDDDDPFCAEWALYSGTLQAISVAGAFGDVGSADVAGLEVVAAASVTQAIEGIGSHWPAELTSERASVLDDLLGAFGRRAEKALAALRDAGATDDHIGQLRIAWDAALRARDPERPVIEVPVLPADLAGVVAAAAAAFDAAATPFADDPSLQVGTVRVPLTDDYLAAHCPDLASSGVGDAV
jgi:hypothetical protein